MTILASPGALYVQGMPSQSFGIDLSHQQKSAFQPWDNRRLAPLPVIGGVPDAGLDELRDEAVFALPETVIIA